MMIPLLLASTLFSLFVTHVFAQTTVELSFDDNEMDSIQSAAEGYEYAVRFSLPPGWISAKITNVKINVVDMYADGGNFILNIYASEGVTILYTTTVDVPVGASLLWLDVSLPDILVDGDFYISYEFGSDIYNALSFDTDSVSGNSYWKSNAPDSTWQPRPNNLMIRAIVMQVEQEEPEDMLDDLVTEVESLNVPLDFILTNPLKRALRILDRSERAAISQINTFVRRCRWYYRFGFIDQSELTQLIEAAETIMSEI